MTRERIISQPPSSRGLKKEKLTASSEEDGERRSPVVSPEVQKKTFLRVSSRKTSEPKFLPGLRRFLIRRNQKIKIHKRRSGGIGSLIGTQKSRLSSASSNNIRKRKFQSGHPVVSVQASSIDERKRKSSATSPPVLLFQAPYDSGRKRESPARGPPVLTIQDRSNPMCEQGEPDLTSSPRPMSHMNRKKKILRESNAVSPATVKPDFFQNNNVRVGFDRRLQPLKILKMAELRGKNYFMMKWKGSDILDLVPTEVAKEKCPQVVIEFYEKHLKNVHNRAMDSCEPMAEEFS